MKYLFIKKIQINVAKNHKVKNRNQEINMKINFP